MARARQSNPLVGATLPNFTIRPITPADLDAVAPMAGDLVRAHHGWDPQRFMLPDDVDNGYHWWLGKELENRKALVVAAQGARGALVGYAYARVEPLDWNALLEKHAALHDIFVKPAARRHGVARLLLDAVFAWARSKKVPRVVLHTAVNNVSAQALFTGQGFRPTMLEMTREL